MQIKSEKLVPWFLTFVILLFSAQSLSAQDSPKTETALNFTTLKHGDGSRTFNAIITALGDEGDIPVFQAEILFYSIDGVNKSLIGKATSNEEGIANFTATPAAAYLLDITNTMTLSAEFNETQALAAAESSMSLKDMSLKMELVEEDSTKTINISATEASLHEMPIPVAEADVVFYVAGLFTRLNIGTATIENGSCSFPFPSDLKGDEYGMLKIFAVVEDHSDYGTVEAQEDVQWGIHRTNYVDATRQLWTKGAPIWMIVTLTILLIGVWSHYVYAIVQLIFIKKEGDNITKSNK